ncbi:Clavaminate synthase-like protein [Stereum hirsutum FP-91666 SS1]|uniref:Clavaminate synthase-like protein n=1 Tax=Stereum hirsutum (strain FP-91666) TaxID=721885 RepID=UPI000440BE56|nr:Clavaminate synthase-like protein [Stereum hirsutum FP-91666 SS1]EIM91456.1 Clavaminate synthase-like protein [Stereum hirsutum FP-91666 SS1]
MPAVLVHPIPHWTPAPVTKEPLKWAELEVIDLEKAKTIEGRAELVVKARDAMHKQGFFYVVNHGLEKAQASLYPNRLGPWTYTSAERIFDIAAVPFEGVPPEEMKPYVADIKATGEYEGYKPMQYWHIDNGIRDRLEQYNFNRNVNYKKHPSALRPLLPEIQEFVRFDHENVVHEIERLLALGLGLPEDTLTKITSFNSENNGYFNPYEDGEWCWVKHIENALILRADTLFPEVVNCGDSMSMISGGFYKSAVHRVVQPPSDQHGYQRLGVYYFCHFDDDIQLGPLRSPLLQPTSARTAKETAEAAPPIVREWRKARVAAYGTSELKKSAEKGVEEEFIDGIRVKHYS